ncbi:Frataxin [Tilletiaria anomala UBC 951]|uniref:ferroxidase n=1 Tax=Tilletiaria anomala (strain ATCC 24038 / CBS 436.72 / UBC 951) TaxID=1037660 RepID=A0A066W3D5_TILAU|nr:Frataxin [Tilletiaria anomala UBC 951]KDN45604.1 Frataxin [Tilletiaria anomala UBC 951]
MSWTKNTCACGSSRRISASLDAATRRQALSLTRPVLHGEITNLRPSPFSRRTISLAASKATAKCPSTQQRNQQAVRCRTPWEAAAGRNAGISSQRPRGLHSSTAARKPNFKRANLTMTEYNKVSNLTLDSLQDKLEAVIEEADQNGEDWDIEAAAGVLNVKFGSHGTYVINKQPPNQQIWLSSPYSGPYRMSFASASEDKDGNSTGETGGLWFSKREGQDTVELWSLLRTEIGRIVSEEEAGVLVP